MLGVAGCKSASSDACDPTDPLCGSNRVASTVTVDPDTVSLSTVGATQQLTHSVLDQNGQPINNAPVTWRSDNQNVVTVSTSGVVRAEGAGTTRVHATSGSATAAVTASVCVPGGTIPFADVRFDNLATTDCLLSGGFYADMWTLNVTTPDTIQIDLLSATFDAYVGLLDSGGAILAEADDHDNPIGAPFYDASARIRQPVGAGSYTIVATSFTSAGTGPYQLSVGLGLPCPEEALVAIPSSTAQALAVASDCSYSLFLADVYVVRVASSSSPTFTATSAAFDAYLTLYDPSGNILYEDDNAAGGTNARISQPLTPAWYVIEVSSAIQGQTGNYTLTIN
jgi:hypothetical protein